MRLSHQVGYAICGMFDLAYHGRDQPVQVRVIGDRQGVPTRYLEQIFQRLRKAELVTGKRGPGGGYVLARPASRINLRDIVEAIEGPIEESVDLSATFADAGDPAYRPGFLWAQLARSFGDLLAETTLEALCRDAAQASVERWRGSEFTYHI